MPMTKKRVIIEVARRGRDGDVTLRQLGSIVPPIVADAIADDNTVVLAAAAAVTDEIAGRDIVEIGNQITTGKNLYDPAVANPGTVLTSGGGLTADATFQTSDYIRVVAGLDYSYSGVGSSSTGPIFVAYYDMNKVLDSFVDHGGAEFVMTAPSPVNGFVRASFRTTMTPQIEQASLPTQVEPYHRLLPQTWVGSDNLIPGAVGRGSIGVSEVMPEHARFVEVGKNLYDSSRAIMDTAVNPTNGGQAAQADFIMSDYIPVVAGQPYTISSARVYALYDAQRTYISGALVSQGAPTTITPVADGYLRFSFSALTAVNPSQMQVEAGAASTAYEPYTISVPNIALTGEQVATVISQIPAPDGAMSTLPEQGRTINILGDLHIGNNANGVESDLLDKTFTDLATVRAYSSHRVYVGDVIEAPDTTGTTPGANDTAFLARATLLDADRGSWDVAIGNHDMNADRTADEWATVYGYADQNYVRDLGFCRLVFVGSDDPVNGTNSVTLSASTLSWLDTTLGADSRDAIIFSHGPLERTVYNKLPGQAESTDGFSSVNPNFFTQPSADVLALLDTHTNVRAWVSGHTHSHFENLGCITRHWTGSRSIVHINAGAINGAARSAATPPRSLFMTVRPDDIEVRVRDHATARWHAIRGEYVTTISKGPEEVPAGNPTMFVFPLDGTVAGETIHGAGSLTLVGTPPFTTIGAEQGLDLSVATNRATLNPSDLLLPGEGSIIVRVVTANTGATKDVVYQAAISGHSRLYLQSNSSNLASATIASGSSISTSYPVPVGVPVTLAIDWSEGEAHMRVNGQDAGSTGHVGLQAFGTVLYLGGRTNLTGVGGALLGVAGFNRMLTSEEHMQFVNTPSDDWTMTTVQGV